MDQVPLQRRVVYRVVLKILQMVAVVVLVVVWTLVQYQLLVLKERFLWLVHDVYLLMRIVHVVTQVQLIGQLVLT